MPTMSRYKARFFDFYTHPENPELLVKEAKRYGYSGIGVLNETINGDITLPADFSIYRGVEIRANGSRIREEIKKYRHSHLILIINGGGEEINRAAVESDGLDILLQPSEFNNVLAKAAEDNGVAIGFNLGPLIRLRGERRVRELNIMRNNLKHARKYGLQMILTGAPGSVFDLRAPREMIAISSLFGMTESEAIGAMSGALLGILRKKSDNYIQEGVEIV